MNGKSTVWIILFLLASGAAGTGFYLNYQNSRQVKEQMLAIEEITDNLVTSRTQNRSLEEEVEALKSSSPKQQQTEQVTAQLAAKEKELDTLKDLLSGKEAELATLSEQMVALQQQQDTIATLTQQLEEKDARLQKTLDQQQQFQQQQDELARDLQTKADEIQALTAQLETMAETQTTLTQLRAERDQLAGQLATQQAAVEPMTSDRGVDERVMDLSQKVVALEASQQEKDAVITRQDARIQALTEQFTTGQQELGGKITELTSVILSSQTADNETGSQELEQKLQELTQQLEATNQGLSQQEDIAELRAQLSAKDVQDARITSQLEALTAERDQLAAQLTKQEQQLAQKDSVVQDLTIRLEQLTNDVLPAGSLDQKKIAELTRQIAELTSQIADITRQITNQESKKERLQEQITSITQQLENAIQEKDGLLLDLMKQRESEKQATEAEKEELQQQILTLEAHIQQKDSDISGFKTLLDEKEAALLHLQSTFDADVAVREEKIASLQKTLAEMDEKYQQLTGQYTLQEQSLAALRAEIQSLTEQKEAADQSVPVLQDKNTELLQQLEEIKNTQTLLEEKFAQTSQQLNEAHTKSTKLEENLATREAEYQQKVAEHNQMITQLKDDIENENMEKTGIQERLQTELERSESDYQERLKQLALQKEQEIRELQTMAETYEQMTEDLSQQIQSKDIEISQYKEQLTLKIVDKIVFSSGRAAINAEGRKVLDTVGEFLKQNLDGREIQVNGHTDAVPIGQSVQDKFPTNWELSTARAVNVVRYLQEAADIPASKLSAVGHGQHRPVADNDTPEGRALNRRIEIVLIPELPISE